MRWYIIKSGVVVNFIVADQAFIDAMDPVYDQVVSADGVFADIGWTYSNGVFSQPESPP